MRPVNYCMIALLSLWGCSNLGPDLAGTSEQGNSKVLGSVVSADGVPAAGVVVSLRSSVYDPVVDKPLQGSRVDTTDAKGNYSFSAVDSGVYAVFAIHPGKQTRCFTSNISVRGDSVQVPAGTLRKPGAMKVMLPDAADSSGIRESSGYFYIPGTPLSVLLSDKSGFVVLDSVPAGESTPLFYSESNNGSARRRISDSIQVLPGVTTVITNFSWKYSTRLFLNTTASGAGVSGTILNFPVLIRLTDANFNFGQAMGYGSDLRFSKSDGTRLDFEIERWDPGRAAAEIWVNVDTVHGNDNSRSIIMYWGNASAGPTGNSGRVFDTAAGFQGVWHMQQAGGSIAADATANRFNGTPYNMDATAAVNGAIGTAQEFDGSTSYIRVPGSSSGRLNFPMDGYYSLSAWVYVDTIAIGPGYVFISKGEFQYNLEVDKDYGNWHMSEFHSGIGWQRTGAPATAGKWSHIVGVRNGTGMQLYVNGVAATDTDFVQPNAVPRDTTKDVMLGRISNMSNRYMDGRLDELRINNRSLSPDWIRLCYMNQKPDGDALVEFGRK